MRMFYFLISKGDGSFCSLFSYQPIKIPLRQPRHRLLSHHRQPVVLADGQVARRPPMGEEAHGVAFLLRPAHPAKFKGTVDRYWRQLSPIGTSLPPIGRPKLVADKAHDNGKDTCRYMDDGIKGRLYFLEG